MKITLDPNSLNDYRKFNAIRRLPHWRVYGRVAEFPDEYAHLVGVERSEQISDREYTPVPGMFDYQEDITRLAIARRKFSVFADCGLGKTLILLEFVRHAAEQLVAGRKILIVSPLMVIEQTLGELDRFEGTENLPIDIVLARELRTWLEDDNTNAIGITNYEAIKPGLPSKLLDGLVLDESSMLKSHYGKWGTSLLEMGRGLTWKLALTGTPAPNDRIEYANHAVFMDAFRNVNAFLATYFVNRGQTQERWVLKDHALGPFYRALSHWCIFLTNPATYGWRDNCESIPDIHVHIEHVDLTDEQRTAVQQQTRQLFATHLGGITTRSKLSQISKGNGHNGAVGTKKPAYIRAMLDRWPTESTIIWCHYNAEQEQLAKTIPDAGNITGATPLDERITIIDDFKAGRIRTLISKPKILGFGLNLQVATRQIFSGINDSYESYYQAVKRSNRYGSTRPLNVHVPVTELEEPMIRNVLRKAKRVQADTETQERMFHELAQKAGLDFAPRRLHRAHGDA